MRPDKISAAASIRARSKRLDRSAKTTNPTLFQVVFLVRFVIFVVAARHAVARRDAGFHAARTELAKRIITTCQSRITNDAERVIRIGVIGDFGRYRVAHFRPFSTIRLAWGTSKSLKV